MGYITNPGIFPTVNAAIRGVWSTSFDLGSDDLFGPLDSLISEQKKFRLAGTNVIVRFEVTCEVTPGIKSISLSFMVTYITFIKFEKLSICVAFGKYRLITSTVSILPENQEKGTLATLQESIRCYFRAPFQYRLWLKSG